MQSKILVKAGVCLVHIVVVRNVHNVSDARHDRDGGSSGGRHRWMLEWVDETTEGGQQGPAFDVVVGEGERSFDFCIVSCTFAGIVYCLSVPSAVRRIFSTVGEGHSSVPRSPMCRHEIGMTHTSSCFHNHKTHILFEKAVAATTKSKSNHEWIRRRTW